MQQEQTSAPSSSMGCSTFQSLESQPDVPTEAFEARPEAWSHLTDCEAFGSTISMSRQINLARGAEMDNKPLQPSLSVCAHAQNEYKPQATRSSSRVVSNINLDKILA